MFSSLISIAFSGSSHELLMGVSGCIVFLGIGLREVANELQRREESRMFQQNLISLLGIEAECEKMQKWVVWYLGDACGLIEGKMKICH